MEKRKTRRNNKTREKSESLIDKVLIDVSPENLMPSFIPGGFSQIYFVPMTFVALVKHLLDAEKPVFAICPDLQLHHHCTNT